MRLTLAPTLTATATLVAPTGWPLAIITPVSVIAPSTAIKGS